MQTLQVHYTYKTKNATVQTCALCKVKQNVLQKRSSLTRS